MANPNYHIPDRYVIRNLVEILNHCRNEYYNLNNPSISDQEYDKKFDELKRLEKETGIVFANSPTQTVGYEVKGKLNKVQHDIPLLSLDKTKSVDNILEWIQKPSKENFSLAMLKADGLTIKLEYQNGELVKASTRGSGSVGEDVTHNAKTFKNLPIRIPCVENMTVIGEAVIHQNDFEKINENLSDEEKYKTPRNLAAGSVRQLNNKLCEERNVCFYAFGIQECDEGLFDSKFQKLVCLQSQGIETVPFVSITTERTTETLQGDIKHLRDVADCMFIPIDGLVFTYDSEKYSKSLGATSHHPLHSIAFKFEDEVAETALTDIEWSVGRTGAITPVAIFEPVILDGTEVTRASLHNISILEELELGIGDVVTVYKANMIIPQIEENLTRSNTLEIPAHCPSCGHETEIKQLNDSKVLQCFNLLCPEQMLGRFSHFVSRNAMNIEGLSEATLEKFIEKGFVKTFDDIYQLEQYQSEIVKMDGFGLKSYNKLIDAIGKSRNVKMESFLYALGIQHIGRSASKTISRYFKGNWFDFEAATINGFDFTKLEDFGTAMHDSIYSWYNNGHERKFWINVTTAVNFIREEKTIIDAELKDLSGITFVITGSVNTFKNRDEFKELVESLGGKTSGSVSKNTNYLVSNEASGSSKSKKAQELGVTVITETEFNEMIGRKV